MAELANWIDADFEQEKVFGALIMAIGFESEKCCVDGLEGIPFWSDDSFETAPRNGEVRVVSGSGDGAQQDFLRLATGKPVHLLVDALFANTQSDLESWQENLWHQIKPDPALPDAPIDELKRIKDLKTALAAVPPQIRARWDNILEHSLFPTLPLMLIKGNNMTLSYPMNAFLVLLIDDWATKVKSLPSRLSLGREIENVEIIAATGMRRIYFKDSAETLDALVIVIRHGIEYLVGVNPSTPRTACTCADATSVHLPSVSI